MKVTAGQQIGRLTAIEQAGRSADGHVVWRCRCACGRICERQTNSLRSTRSPACNVCAAESMRKANTKHGMRGTPAYYSWCSAIARCHNPASKDFPSYGARGITVCERWRASFENFAADMGERPAGTTLDRFPRNDGNYEPGNCRWATRSEQQRNRHCSVFVQWHGRATHLADVAADLGVTYGAAYMQFKRGPLP